jgi:hypothetical protein
VLWNNARKWRWVAGAAVIVVVLYVSAVGAGWSDVLLDGQKVPVPDAWVIATRKECAGLAHCREFCAEVQVVRSNELGKYTVRSWHRKLDYEVRAYREGSQFDNPLSNGEPIVLDARAERQSNPDLVAERIEYLARLAGDISCTGAPKKQQAAVLNVHRTMFREAMSLARSPEQQERARDICQLMYIAELDTVPPPSERETQRTLYALEPQCESQAVVEEREPSPTVVTPAPVEQRMIIPKS